MQCRNRLDIRSLCWRCCNSRVRFASKESILCLLAQTLEPLLALRSQAWALATLWGVVVQSAFGLLGRLLLLSSQLGDVCGASATNVGSGAITGTPCDTANICQLPASRDRGLLRRCSGRSEARQPGDFYLRGNVLESARLGRVLVRCHVS